MSNVINVLSAGAQAAGPGLPLSSRAQALLQAATSAGVVDLKHVAAAVADVAAGNLDEAADLLAEIGPRLGDAEQRQLREGVADALYSHAADAGRPKPPPPGLANPPPTTGAMVLDLVQMGLSIAGLFDPTPICDGLDGLISLMRGDLVGAGISAVSMIPYLGDAAKLGKLGKFANTLASAVDLARVDPRAARKLAPAIDRIRGALDAIAPGALSRPLREVYEKIRKSLDQFGMLGRPQPRLAMFDQHRLQDVLQRVGDEADLIDDLLDPVRAGIERAARTGAKALDPATCRRIEHLVDTLRRQTFAELVDAAGESSVLHELFVAAERNVGHRAVLREFGDASDDIGELLARRFDLEDALESTASRRAASRIDGQIGAVSDELETLRAYAQSDRTPRAAYELIRDEMKRLAARQGIEWPDDVVIHHLVPIHVSPELATHPANLLLVRSGADQSHDLVHRLLGGEETNLWAGFNANVLAVIQAALDL